MDFGLDRWKLGRLSLFLTPDEVMIYDLSFLGWLDNVVINITVIIIVLISS